MTRIVIKTDSEPITPATGRTVLYMDSTTKRLRSKDDQGVVTEYVRTIDTFPSSEVVQVNFGDESYKISQVVTNTTFTENALFTIENTNEELLLQGVSFYITDRVVGVGYTLNGIAPNGASGTYNITVVIK